MNKRTCGTQRRSPSRNRQAQTMAIWTTACTLTAIAMLPLTGGTAHAIDVNASDYVPAPAGTNLFLWYNQYATRSEYISASGQKLSNDTGLDSYISILRYVHYFEIGGFTIAPQVLLPLGTMYDGRLGGVKMDSASGVGDPILATTVWLLNNKETETYLGIMPYLFLPMGQYDPQQGLNMGGNRWQLDLQAGWHQGLGNGFSFQLTGDVVWYGANNEAPGGGRLTQDTTYQFQGWLNWAFAPTWQASAGYARLWGGTEYLDGIATGNATRKDQARFELSKFITPTFQVLALVQRDFNTEGGFQEDFRGTLRLMQAF